MLDSITKQFDCFIAFKALKMIFVLLPFCLTCGGVDVVVVVVVVVLLVSLVEVVPRAGLGSSRVHGWLGASSVPATVIPRCNIWSDNIILTCGSPLCMSGGTDCREWSSTALHTEPPHPPGQTGTDPAGILPALGN